MKNALFNVICLNKESGWLMFFLGSNNGFSQSHNPLQARTYTETEADELVIEYTEYLRKTEPARWQDYCVAKVKLG